MRTNKPIVLEHVFEVSSKEVWQAITELEQMKLWFFDNIPSFDPVTMKD